MIDLRYHIYSIAAVFLALAIGMVIGTGLKGSNAGNETAQKTIRRYEANMNKLKDEIVLASNEASAKSEIADKYRKFCEVLMPEIVDGKLAGKNIALIQTGDDEELMGLVTITLRKAGAKVTSVITVNTDFDTENDKEISDILISAGMNPTGDDKTDAEKLFAVLAENVITGSFAEIMPKLSAGGFANAVGDYYSPNSAVVMIGGHSKADKDEDVEPVISGLMAQLEKKHALVVGCESIDAVLSYIPFWKKCGIATVDDADTAIGRISLVCALTGEVANFGIKDTSDRFVPQSLETKQ